MDLKTDEDEHSIEMQLPYTAKIMERLVTSKDTKFNGIKFSFLQESFLCEYCVYNVYRIIKN